MKNLPVQSDLPSKLKQALPHGFAALLPADDLSLLADLAETYRFSVQQLQQFSQWFLDCHSWEENDFFATLKQERQRVEAEFAQRQARQRGDLLFKILRDSYLQIQGRERHYTGAGVEEFRPRYRYEEFELEDNFHHICPAITRQECGVCCGLQVFDVVENCAMGCTYCILQSRFEESRIRVPENLKEKLDRVQVDPDKRIRIGTGQSSDSLMWGNRNNILGDLFDWTVRHPNVILELKTKSAAIQPVIDLNPPPNICCSWSLNPDVVIRNEEHGTVGLDARLKAARKAADAGIRVGFHLHPMMYYEGWESDYEALIHKVISMFEPHEVLWFTLGTITLPDGLDEQVRKNWKHSRLLQMPREVTPDGKVTYSKDIRLKLYHNAWEALKPWRDQVILYMCMEFRDVWQEVCGYYWPTIDSLNEAIAESAFPKLKF